MDRNTWMWTLVLFFGGTILFGAIRRATADESAGVSFLLGVAALVVVLGVILAISRRRRD